MHSFREFYNMYKSPVENTGETYSDFTKTVAPLQQTNDTIAPKKNSECLIVIPAYTNKISEFEQMNLKNNVEKLGKCFDICIVCPKLLRADVYNSIVSGVELQYLRLPSRNFIGKNSYSNMLLSADFYKHFTAWKYILILQLDVYIFGTADDLKNFVAMDKTYIGAPWTKEYASSIGIPEETCGNGGLSLRKV